MSVTDDIKRTAEAIDKSPIDLSEVVINSQHNDLVYIQHLYRKLEKENERLKLKIKELEG